MPDRYGRVTGEDLFKLGQGIAQMNEANQKEQDRRELGLGLNALGTDPNAVQPQGISGVNWNKAQQEFGRAQAGMVLARESADAGQRASYRNSFMAEVGKGKTPEDQLRILQGLNPTDYAGALALADVYDTANKSGDLRGAMLRRDLEDGARRYSSMTDTLKEAQRLHKADDVAGAGAMLGAMSDQARTRDFWRYNPETGVMDKWHNKREEGLVATGESLSVGDLLGTASQMNRQDFALYEAKNRAATRDFNAKSLLSGGYLATGPKGEDLRVIPQINMEDMSKRDFWVFDGKGKAVGTYDEDGFLKSGVMVDKNQKLYFRGGRTSGGTGGGRGKTLLDEALAVGTKAANQAGKDGLTTPEEARDAGDAAAFEHVEKKTGVKVSSWDDVRRLSGQPKGAQPQQQAAPAAGGLGLGGGGAQPAQRTSAQALLDEMHAKK